MRKKTLDNLRCPYCRNERLYIEADFKYKQNREVLVKCIKKIYKPAMLRKYKKNIVRGCGKIFELTLPKKDAE